MTLHMRIDEELTRPQIISLESQYELKHLDVETGGEGLTSTKFSLGPALESRLFVIQNCRYSNLLGVTIAETHRFHDT